jgi:hypothetical protein
MDDFTIQILHLYLGCSICMVLPAWTFVSSVELLQCHHMVRSKECGGVQSGKVSTEMTAQRLTIIVWRRIGIGSLSNDL